MNFTIVPERPDDAALLDPLLDRTFGFDRQEKTVYRLRDGVQPVAGLSFSAIAPDGGCSPRCVSGRCASPGRAQSCWARSPSSRRFKASASGAAWCATA